VCNSTVPADSILHAHSPPLCPKISGPKIKSSSSLSSWAGFKDNDARKGVELDRQKLPANIGSGVARKKGAHWLWVPTYVYVWMCTREREGRWCFIRVSWHIETRPRVQIYRGVREGSCRSMSSRVEEEYQRLVEMGTMCHTYNHSCVYIRQIFLHSAVTEKPLWCKFCSLRALFEPHTDLCTVLYGLAAFLPYPLCFNVSRRLSTCLKVTSSMSRCSESWQAA